MALSPHQPSGDTQHNNGNGKQVNTSGVAGGIHKRHGL